MRRVLLVTMLAGVVAGGPAAQAASSPQLRDARGDWTVESQDVLSARLSTTADKTLVGELTLAAAPAQGVATDYGFHFLNRCIQWSFTYRWAGTAETSEAAFERADFCSGSLVVDVETFPVTFAQNGASLTWRTPYVAGIADGLAVQGFAAAACSTVCGVFYTFSTGHSGTVSTGDVGYSDTRYVVGSERRRR